MSDDEPRLRLPDNLTITSTKVDSETLLRALKIKAPRTLLRIGRLRITWIRR